MSVIKVEIGNGRCEPDFNGPNTKSIDDDYEYFIGKDKDLKIKFKDASNGNCKFESKLEIDGPSEAVALFLPAILV